MGRKRIDDEEKAIGYKISIKAKYIELLKQFGSPSKIITKLVEEYLKNKGKL